MVFLLTDCFSGNLLWSQNGVSSPAAQKAAPVQVKLANFMKISLAQLGLQVTLLLGEGITSHLAVLSYPGGIPCHLLSQKPSKLIELVSSSPGPATRPSLRAELPLPLRGPMEATVVSCRQCHGGGSFPYRAMDSCVQF